MLQNAERQLFFDDARRRVTCKRTLATLELDPTSYWYLRSSSGEIATGYSIPSRDYVESLKEAMAAAGVQLEETSTYVNSDWPLQVPILHIIKNCNSPCIMCDCWKTKQKEHLKRSELKPLLKKIYELGARRVMLSGGEPLLHPELAGIINDCREHRLAVELNTNGLLLPKREWLFTAKVGKLAISLDGAGADQYEFYRGIDKRTSVLKAAARFKECSPDTSINLRVTLTADVLRERGYIKQIAQLNFVDFVSFSPADTQSPSFARGAIAKHRSADLIKAMLPEPDEIEQLLMEYGPGGELGQEVDCLFEQKKISWNSLDFSRCLKFYYFSCHLDMECFSNATCLFPENSFLLDYDGSFRSCFYADSFGNLKGLNDVDWELSGRREKLERDGKCRTCRGKVFCSTDDTIV